jgi:hypothetical protein
MTEAVPAKTSRKLLLIVFLLLALTPLLCWIGGLLYWRIRVGSAIREWDASTRNNPRSQAPSSIPDKSAQLLYRAGCRALPQLIDAMNASKDPRFQQNAMAFVLTLMVGFGPYSEESMREYHDWDSRWSFRADGLDFERRKKLENFNAWWASNGSRYHQPWRVWSNYCHGD